MIIDLSFYIIDNKDMIRIKLLSVFFLFLVGVACNVTPGGTPGPTPTPTPILTPGPTPTPAPTPQPPPSPQLTTSPNYCQAQVAPEQAAQIHQFVVDAYNHHMAGIQGFKTAKTHPDNGQPLVSFAVSGKPSFFYPNRPPKFHTTLCMDPSSKFLRCNDGTLLTDVASVAKTSDPLSEYTRYYTPFFENAEYTYASGPEEFGPLFIALPLNPVNLRDQNGHVVSGLLHISLAKVNTSDSDHAATEASKHLRERFLQALKQDFRAFRQRLPQVRFTKVVCWP
jgi:hypothetical protein